MENESGIIVRKALDEDEFNKIPEDISKKIDSYFEENFLKTYIESKAIAETYRTSIDEIRTNSEEKVNDLTLKIQEESAKLVSAQECIKELREELDEARKESSELTEAVKKYEKESLEYRKDRNGVIDERDSLLKMVERRDFEIQRLELDMKSLKQQLQNAITAKCETQAKYDEIQHKEASLEFKEKSMDQERILLQNQIASLTEDLNRNISELQNIRRETNLKTVTIETRLTEKIEELKVANSNSQYLTEMNSQLSAKVEDLTSKMLTQSEEMAKMIEQYKKELSSQTRLANLYKESVDESNNQQRDLSNVITELREMLNEATDSYGKLETEYKAYKIQIQSEFDEKNKQISDLQDELKNANQLLSENEKQSAEEALQKFYPTAAATSKIIKSGYSLTEIYTMYVNAKEELENATKQNSQLKLRIEELLAEAEANAPTFKKLKIELQTTRETNDELLHQIDKLIHQKTELNDEKNDVATKIKYFENENKKLRVERQDLSRQVCVLLRQIEEARGNYSSQSVDYDVADGMTANELISRKLVTFTNIEDLQQKNQSLISCIREISARADELEELKNNMDQATYESKIENYNKRLNDLQDTIQNQNSMMQKCMQQRDRYKQMYLNLARNSGDSHMRSASLNGSFAGMDQSVEDEEAPSNTSMVSSELFQSSIAEKDKKIQEMETKVKDIEKSLKSAKEEYDEYRKDKQTNDKMMNEQFDTMRTELRELSTSNCKLLAQVQHNEAQFQLQQKNIATYKKQIQTLEERNKIYETTIAKHETSLQYLRTEIMNNQQKLATTEIKNEKLVTENRALKESESRMKAEREVHYRERQSQQLLLSNLEMIKASFERSETEGKMRLETRLDEMTRECSALRRRLQEEQDRFREAGNDLKRQTESAKKRMEEEIEVAQKLQVEIKNLREEIDKKTSKIDELSKKLQMSLTPTQEDNPIAQANKRVKEMEIQVKDQLIEIESLRRDLEASREHAKQYCNLAETAEKEYNALNNEFTEYKTRMDAELAKIRKSESHFKEKYEEMMTEISLDITNARLNAGDVNTQLHKAQTELKEALLKISENNKELKQLREKCDNFGSALETAEQKYANEMILHSSDIKAMALLKEEMSKTRQQFDELRTTRDVATQELEGFKKLFVEKQERLEKDKEELETRLSDLDKQNKILHDQIQSLSSKLSLNVSQNVDISMSSNAGEESICDKSFSEEDGKSSEQLLQIIKYLRKEKDIAFAKFDLLRSENARLKSEQGILEKKVENLQTTLNSKEMANESVALNAAKHEELLRKVETLNAITDSNRILRDERDSLAEKIKIITDRYAKAECELVPIQEQNRDLTVKLDSLKNENATLRTEATRWRLRANNLVERSSKTSAEDFKRIQTEKETLSKQLAEEKALHKKTSDEFQSIKTEKAKLDQEIANLNKQVAVLSADNKKFQDELTSLRQSSTKMNMELTDIKSKLILKEDEIKKLTDEVANKETQLNDSKSKENQIRKIAKRYKDLYTELKTQVDNGAVAAIIGENAENAGGDVNVGEAGPSQDTQVLEAKIKELEGEIAGIKEEQETLKQENEALKSNVEKDEKSRQLLKDAKQRIMSLTEYKNQTTQQLQMAQKKCTSLEQNKEENELLMKSLKTQYEMRIKLLEKDLSEQTVEKNDIIQRLQRDNESLSSRIQHLNRMLGNQQSVKPTTSTMEKNPNDASPRTANVKPMAGPSQQSATVQPWRGSSSSGDTPLASIRPMSVQNNRTAAVLPTSQTSNVSGIQGSSQGTSSTTTSSSAGPSSNITALVPPQQQVHTTGSQPGEAMSSSPTSSHTDYMPATSSAGVAVAAVIPMGSSSSTSSNAAESSSQSQEAEMQNSESSQVSGGQQQQQQQVVALVSPRIENAPSLVTQQQQISEQSPSTSASTSSSSSVSQPQSVAMSSHHQASSSNTVTTSQAGSHKRPRDVEGDSSTGSNDEPSDKMSVPQKRVRVQGDTFQGVSESGLDVEYQVPTSSQRDQDDIIVVDSDEDDEGMADEGNAEADEDPFDNDGNENFEMEGYEQEPEIAGYDEGPDIDDDNNIQSANNEVEVDDVPQVPNQSSAQQGAEAGSSTSTSSNVVGQSSSATTSSSTVNNSQSSDQTGSTQNQSEAQQQIQSISSGSNNDAGPSTSMGSTTSQWRQSPNTSSRQQHTAHLMLTAQNYDETSDDRIVPSTPTLYANRRSDGFAEVVSSPHPHVPHTARFTFNESAQASRSNAPGTLEGMDDTRIDLSEEHHGGVVSGRSVPNTPQQTSPPEENILHDSTSTSSTSSSISTVVQQDNQAEQQPIAGSSSQDVHESHVPEISVTAADDDYSEDNADDAATTSDSADKQSGAENEDVGEVTSENAEDESSEADMLDQPSSNTRSLRSVTVRGSNIPRGHGSRQSRGRPTPIVWVDSQHQSRGSPQYQGRSQRARRGSRGRGNSPAGGFNQRF